MAHMALWGQDKPAQKRQGVTVEGWLRSRLVGQWLSGWVPEQQVEPKRTGTAEMEALREQPQE